jgi:hypothetical protein
MARIALVLAALVIPLLPLPANAEPAAPPTPASDTVELTNTHFTLDGERLPEARPHPSRRRETAAVTPPVGTKRQLLGVDSTDDSFYRKDFTLRGVGAHIEVWVADDLSFPAGDCRTKDTEVTDVQVGSLISAFDGTIYPRETAAFSTPPDRDGQNALLSGDFSGAGDKTITLVDNIRDDNYYHFPATQNYVAGAFSNQLNELMDRNVMTIDSYDWTHRSGPNPPGAPTGDPCTSRSARPLLYEATFAHEWQHLLEYYADPDEALWVNEGLSDYAEYLTGYSDPARSIYKKGADPHATCFEGFGIVVTRYNPIRRDCGGPENSLNLWNEGAPNEVLADYGNAYQFMLWLHDRFGPATVARLHQDKADHGLAGVTAALPAGTKLYDAIHEFQNSTLTDKIVGGLPSLESTVNLANPACYDTPGAAPNGADYVRLRDAKGAYLTGDELTSVAFAGNRRLPPAPLDWTITGGVLYSGNKPGADLAAITPVAVPAADPFLRFSTRYALEQNYDFGYVTVSTDGGKSWTAVAGDRTVAGKLGPGLSGLTDGFVPVRYDFSAYAGKKILIGLRFVSDDTINQGGWSIKDITLGKTAIASTTDVFHSPSWVTPEPVHAWSARLAGMNEHQVKIVPVAQFAQLKGFEKVVAIVAYDEPTEQVTRYAPYRLTVNGAVQPGGS